MEDEFDDVIRKRMEEKMRRFMERQRFPDRPVEISDDEFESFVERYPLVVIDFWSTTCPPCRMLAPILDETARLMRGEAVFGKICIDYHRKNALRYGVTGVPTLLIFRKGKPADRIVGLAPKEIIIDRVRKLKGESDE